MFDVCLAVITMSMILVSTAQFVRFLYIVDPRAVVRTLLSTTDAAWPAGRI